MTFITLISNYTVSYAGGLSGGLNDNDSLPSSLLLQPLWSAALRHSAFTSSPAFPMLIYVLCYFLCQLPCTVLDLCSIRWEAIRAYRILPKVPVSWSHLRPVLVNTVWNHILYILPVSLAQWAWQPEIEMPALAPTMWEFCWQQYVSLMIVDAEYYLWHVLHHKNRFLYKHVHSFHHQYTAVNSWVTQYSHPWELFSLGFFSTTAPWILRAHPLTCWCFLAFVLAVSVEDHCGYDLPLMPHRWAPFWGGSLKHSIHHQRPLTNFQPYFNWFDRLFGNEFNAHSSRKLSAAAAAASLQAEEIRENTCGGVDSKGNSNGISNASNNGSSNGTSNGGRNITSSGRSNGSSYGGSNGTSNRSRNGIICNGKSSGISNGGSNRMGNGKSAKLS